jgi:hypothetical protein
VAIIGKAVYCEADLAGINDLYLQTLRLFYKIAGKKAYGSHAGMIMYGPPLHIEHRRY